MGRAILIKSVAQTTPMYAMATFEIPKNLCESMDALIRRFWWSPKKKASHYFAPIARSSLCWTKKGGLGFRRFWDFNMAMLSKFAWCVLIEKDSQCVKTLTSKYKVRNNWLTSSPLANASWSWRSLEKAKKRFCWKELVSLLEMGDLF